jgi:hypothetical protein
VVIRTLRFERLMKTARWLLAIFEPGFRFFVPDKGGSVSGTQAVLLAGIINRRDLS